MECGGLYVMMDGVILMLLLYVGCWVYKQKVRIKFIASLCNFTILLNL